MAGMTARVRRVEETMPAVEEAAGTGAPALAAQVHLEQAEEKGKPVSWAT